MAFMVIHLWGKFWMAAWRGRRALTWVTGVVAFLASVVECFTGYLSQQNFDSQWISTSGKDAFNAVGVGAFFNLMNFGQMLLWHVVLIPIVLVALVGAHVLAVRVRASSTPFRRPQPGAAAARRAAAVADAGGVARADAALRHPEGSHGRHRRRPRPGGCPRRLALLSRRPARHRRDLGQDRPGRLRRPPPPASWPAPARPPPTVRRTTTPRRRPEPPLRPGVDRRGPPTHRRRPDLRASALWRRSHPPIHPLGAALDRYRARALRPHRAPGTPPIQGGDPRRPSADGTAVVPGAADGPVPLMLATELTLARSGALDADLLANHAFYGTDFTKPLLFLEDGQYFSDVATAQHLTGAQWGVMNETGSYPGPTLAVALHAVVPGARLRQLRQRRPHRHLPDRRGHHPPPGRAVPPRTARHPPPRPRPPAHLAQLEPQARALCGRASCERAARRLGCRPGRCGRRPGLERTPRRCTQLDSLRVSVALSSIGLARPMASGHHAIGARPRRRFK